MLSQSVLDDQRQHGAELVENLRFVRERSSEATQVRPFRAINLEKQKLNGLSLDGADFSAANLGGSFLSKMRLAGANLQDASLRNARIGDTRMNSSRLARADLAGIASVC